MINHSVTLYLATVLIWGSTWFAIKFQLGVVAPELSIAYRFGLAALLLLLFSYARKLRLGFGTMDHVWIALQGLFLFSVNYLVFYWATGLLTTGLVAVLFSTIVFMNLFNSALFFRQPIKADVAIGATLGLIGISLMFWPEIAGFRASSAGLTGLSFSLIATFFASLGNMASVRNQKHGLPIVQTNAWGMAYGALFMGIWAVASGNSLSYDPALTYTLSLLYLSVFGSIFAFGSYLTLLGRIGADRAAYATVLFPVVALAISTAFEGYRWTPVAVTGIALILCGNLLVVSKNTRGVVARMFVRLIDSPLRRSM